MSENSSFKSFAIPVEANHTGIGVHDNRKSLSLDFLFYIFNKLQIIFTHFRKIWSNRKNHSLFILSPVFSIIQSYSPHFLLVTPPRRISQLPGRVWTLLSRSNHIMQPICFQISAFEESTFVSTLFSTPITVSGTDISSTIKSVSYFSIPPNLPSNLLIHYTYRP